MRFVETVEDAAVGAHGVVDLSELVFVRLAEARVELDQLVRFAGRLDPLLEHFGEIAPLLE